MPKLISSGYQSNQTGDTVELVPRREFLRDFGKDYKAGQHVSFFGPTGRGKSTLCYQCLQHVVSPNLQVISTHGKIKGRDPVVGKAARQLNLRIVPTLPSETRMRFDRQRKYNGYLIVPLEKPGESAVEENAKLQREFRRAIHHNYKTRNRATITHINEAHQTQEELKLKTDVEAPLMRGAPDNAVWQEAQRGRYLSYHTYGAPEHIFVFYDDDRDNRKRYSDFGCVDPDEIMWLTSNLKTRRVADGRTISQCLYIRRGGGMYLVDT
jgi:energy-coupling factor transporter ATP-binding protein EcfA2